jgi:hypothetical protein
MHHRHINTVFDNSTHHHYDAIIASSCHNMVDSQVEPLFTSLSTLPTGTGAAVATAMRLVNKAVPVPVVRNITLVTGPRRRKF